MTDLRRTAKESEIPTLVNIHDVNLTRAFADRIIGIADGQVVFDAPPDRLDEEALIRVYKGSAAAFAARGSAADGPSANGAPTNGASTNGATAAVESVAAAPPSALH
jgi:phosphonate transport system ATP-binding protein